jgi:16S rRNA U516 pseudouridylate synthase RsuA-like enzyme
LASSTDFGRDRLERQRHQIERFAAGIGVPLVTLPRLATPRLTLHQLGQLADALVQPLIEEAS